MVEQSKQQSPGDAEKQADESHAEKDRNIGSLVMAQHKLSRETPETNGKGTMQFAPAIERGSEKENTPVALSRENSGDQRQPESKSAVGEVAKEKKKKKFNVEKAMKSLPMEMLTRLQKGLTILNFNISGLRTDYKKESLKEMAYQLKFGVGIITETHLLNHEADALKIPHYSVLHREGHSRRKGGVLILAHGNAACRKLETITPPPRLIDGCSRMLYPTRLSSSRFV